MYVFDLIAEARIREAQRNGDFDGLPGAGAPLDLDEDPLIPDDLRVAYRILKNAGFVPAELEAQREIRELDRLLDAVQDEDERAHLLARIAFLLERSGLGRRVPLESEYAAKIAGRLARPRAPRGPRGPA